MINNSKPRIVGITGAFGSGKSTAAQFFSTRSFTTIALSSFLEEEAHTRGQHVITRRLLQDIGNEWRGEMGSGVLAKKALEMIEKDKLEYVIIDGIRNVGEIEMFRTKENFTLISIVSDRQNRFDRLKKMPRREDLTWELFTQLDYRDLGIEGENKTGLQVAYCIALGDIFIENNKTEDEFIARLKEVV